MSFLFFFFFIFSFCSLFFIFWFYFLFLVCWDLSYSSLFWFFDYPIKVTIIRCEATLITCVYHCSPGSPHVQDNVEQLFKVSVKTVELVLCGSSRRSLHGGPQLSQLSNRYFSSCSSPRPSSSRMAPTWHSSRWRLRQPPRQDHKSTLNRIDTTLNPGAHHYYFLRDNISATTGVCPGDVAFRIIRPTLSPMF